MRLDFIFDFGSPNAYLCHRALPVVAARTGAAFNYVPVLLGGIFKATGNRSPIEIYQGVESRNKYDQLEINRFCVEYGIVDFTFNPHFPINTLSLMRGAFAAKKMGVFESYVDEIFKHMWAKPRNLNDPVEIGKVLSESGLDARTLMSMTQEPDIKQQLVASTGRAVEDGVFGAPTFFVGDEMYFGKDRLHLVEDRIRAQNV
ncbi:2-hydroxychromene-2-carboxylate isomerase [Seohaeicola sp.]|uniref:2-hydroxychromene-2-carboxylate isomerase n=1 Tax=Seohaeicola sp. TaxID=2042026 RepID=UPI003A85581E